MKKLLAILCCVIILVLSTGNAFAANASGSPGIAKYFDGQEITMLANKSFCQMNSYVITTKNGGVIVVDGGTEYDAANLAKTILTKGGHVNAWFITHPHNDHAGALTKLLTDGLWKYGITIDAVYLNLFDQGVYNYYEPDRAAFVQQLRDALAPLGNLVHSVHRNDFYAVDDVIVQVMNDPYVNPNRFINNSSVVYRMFIADKRVTFLGDLCEDTGMQFLADHAGEDLTTDFVQMAHHGSYGVNFQFYQMLLPKVCMWNSPSWLYNDTSGNFQSAQVKEWMKMLGVTEHYSIANGNQVIR